LAERLYCERTSWNIGIFANEIEPKYRTITRPVLILWGEQDKWIPIAKGRQLYEAISASEFHAISRAGHLVQEDAPVILAAHLMEFFMK
jgi:pimeloyl-ACP methyl ester carboxylesterase